MGGFFTVALDAVTLELFDRTRGRDLDSPHNIRGMGNHNHMFALFPERGSLMEDREPVRRPERRMQPARVLININNNASGEVSRMRFDTLGRLTDSSMGSGELGRW